ncbi:MAG: DUF2437 domain-containing protein [Candidatus Thiodiazotropha sp. (ex Ustalcina ferruginea)]|nr:DUF2437 domain-containing protein [Candidatus Thiodiazotropha sp. (ex Ustalcina ferruginea)]
MEQWVRYEHQGVQGFGTLSENQVTVYFGDMYSRPMAIGATVPLNEINLLTPSHPTKMIGLWNNFHSRAKQEGWEKPLHPLYFMKAISRLSRGMTLYPGDIIACGTSIGTGPMPPGCTVEVKIGGIGTLVNDFKLL